MAQDIEDEEVRVPSRHSSRTQQNLPQNDTVSQEEVVDMITDQKAKQEYQ